MQPIDTADRHYDRVTRFIHWAVALLIAVQWLGAQTIDWFPRGPLRVDARSAHIAGGVLLAALMAGRIGWRMTRGRRLSWVEPPVIGWAAKMTHWAQYLVVTSMLVVGLLLVWARGDSIFNLFTIPKMNPADAGLPRRMLDIHAAIGWAVVGLAGIHIAAALFHRFWRHDEVLSRVLPGR